MDRDPTGAICILLLSKAQLPLNSYQQRVPTRSHLSGTHFTRTERMGTCPTDPRLSWNFEGQFLQMEEITIYYGGWWGPRGDGGVRDELTTLCETGDR